MQAEDSLQPPAVAQQPEAVSPQAPATIQPAAPPAQPEPVAEAAAPAEQLATPAGKVEVDRDDPFFGWTPKVDDIAPEDLGWAKEPRQGEGHVGGDSLDAQITQEPPKEQAKTVEYMENMGA